MLVSFVVQRPVIVSNERAVRRCSAHVSCRHRRLRGDCACRWALARSLVLKAQKSRGFDAGRLRVVVVRGRTPTFYYGLTVLVLGAATGCLYLASYVPDIANAINAMIDKGTSTAAFGKVTHSLNGTSAATEAKVVSFVTHTLFVTGMSLFFHSMLATAIIIWKFVLADEIAEARGGLIVFLRPSDILFGGLTI
jgi:hypothetical protein